MSRPKKASAHASFRSRRLVRRRRHALRSVDGDDPVQRSARSTCSCARGSAIPRLRRRSPRTCLPISARSAWADVSRSGAAVVRSRRARDDSAMVRLRRPCPSARTEPLTEAPFVGRTRELDVPRRGVCDGHPWPRGGRVRVRPIGHRQERVGALLSRSLVDRRRRRRARRAVLRARIRAVQGTRRCCRQPVAVPDVAFASQQSRACCRTTSSRCRDCSR